MFKPPALAAKSSQSHWSGHSLDLPISVRLVISRCIIIIRISEAIPKQVRHASLVLG